MKKKQEWEIKYDFIKKKKKKKKKALGFPMTLFTCHVGGPHAPVIFFSQLLHWQYMLK